MDGCGSWSPPPAEGQIFDSFTTRMQTTSNHQPEPQLMPGPERNRPGASARGQKKKQDGRGPDDSAGCSRYKGWRFKPGSLPGLHNPCMNMEQWSRLPMRSLRSTAPTCEFNLLPVTNRNTGREEFISPSIMGRRMWT